VGNHLYIKYALDNKHYKWQIVLASISSEEEETHEVMR